MRCVCPKQLHEHFKLERQKWGSTWGPLLRFVECFRDYVVLCKIQVVPMPKSWCHLRLMPRMSQAFFVFFATKMFLHVSFRSDKCIANGLSSIWFQALTHDGNFPRPEGLSQGKQEVKFSVTSVSMSMGKKVTEARAVRSSEGRWKAKRKETSWDKWQRRQFFS